MKKLLLLIFLLQTFSFMAIGQNDTINKSSVSQKGYFMMSSSIFYPYYVNIKSVVALPLFIPLQIGYNWQRHSFNVGLALFGLSANYQYAFLIKNKSSFGFNSNIIYTAIGYTSTALIFGIEYKRRLSQKISINIQPAVSFYDLYVRNASINFDFSEPSPIASIGIIYDFKRKK